MNRAQQELMQNATVLTRAGRLQDATIALQRALGSAAFELPGFVAPAAPRFTAPRAEAGVAVRGVDAWRVLDGLVTDVKAKGKVNLADADRHAAADAFTTRTFSHGGRSITYKLFVPGGLGQVLRPLIVMLHGCTQNPDDFAAGTGMNALAVEHGFRVLYPAQAQDINPQRCWTWFKHNHQQRGRGEPALLAALTQSVMSEGAVDQDRVFIAGLSAGGAMATIVAQAYPDIFSAVGVHSGLARGTAKDAMAAMMAMKSGTGPAAAAVQADSIGVPTIVFHGDADTTVHPDHGGHVLAASFAAATVRRLSVQQGASAQGQRYTQEVYADVGGAVVAEYWQLHNAGHAWSGGSRHGSYTDPRGPEASREMLRFFMAHGRPHKN
ncbi:MAG: PHB depolymerase family esterase [Rhodoferax sp.]